MPIVVNGGWQEAIGCFLAQLDQEIVAIDPRVFQAVHGVVLELVMADVSFFVSPFVWIGVSRVIEFIGPDEVPAW
jgi:hypothetical protein